MPISHIIILDSRGAAFQKLSKFSVDLHAPAKTHLTLFTYCEESQDLKNRCRWGTCSTPGWVSCEVSMRCLCSIWHHKGHFCPSWCHILPQLNVLADNFWKLHQGTEVKDEKARDIELSENYNPLVSWDKHVSPLGKSSHVRPQVPLRCIVIQLYDMFSIEPCVIFVGHQKQARHHSSVLCLLKEKWGDGGGGDGGRGGVMGRTWKREHHYSDTQLCALCTVWVMHLQAEPKYSECFEMERNSAVAMELSEFELLC